MERSRLGQTEQPIRLPSPQPVPMNAAAFVLCALPGIDPALMWMQQELYRWALAQAQAVMQPSIVERDLAAVWN